MHAPIQVRLSHQGIPGDPVALASLHSSHRLVIAFGRLPVPLLLSVPALRCFPFTFFLCLRVSFFFMWHVALFCHRVFSLNSVLLCGCLTYGSIGALTALCFHRPASGPTEVLQQPSANPQTFFPATRYIYDAVLPFLLGAPPQKYPE